MSALLSQLTFLNPWLLAATALLPVLWFLLRVTPPAPKRIFFPAAHFLKGLLPERTTPSKTPWWLLLLRCSIAALVILALARPVLNPSDSLPGQSDIRIIVENGWAAAQVWDKQIQQAEALIAQAERENRNVYVMTTAPEPLSLDVQHIGPMTPSQGLSHLRGLTPNPWSSDFSIAREKLTENTVDRSIVSFWVGSGLNERGVIEFARTAQEQGGLYYYEPETINLPIAVKMSNESDAQGINLDILRAGNSNTNLPINIHAIGENGNILDYQSFSLTPQDNSIQVILPDTIRNTIARIDVSGRNSAGTTILLDERFRKRSVGIVTSDEGADPKPLIDASFYLTRALEPYTTLHTGTIETLIETNPSTIIMPDIGAMPPSTLDALESWVKDGGLLLRFAGSAMSATENFLVPVPLLRGTRALDGDLTWSEPQKLAPFPETSPFFGLAFDDPITVRQQILAEPISDLEEKTWATLEDGTPLITASKLNKGLLVFIHTTATPDWSDLALSGLYVELLREIVALSKSKQVSGFKNDTLQPLSVLDGFARQIEPKGVKPIPAQEFDSTKPTANTPPGFYGQGGNVKALNLGEHLRPLRAMTNLPNGVSVQSYNKIYETDLMPVLLSAALVLLMIDWIIMMIMALGLRLNMRAASASIIVFSFIITMPVYAQNNDTIYAGGIYLAYVKTGNTSVDQTAQRGLEALSRVLTQRTSVEPKGTVGLNPERDDMAFFPFIYWPVTDEPLSLSDTALQNIQHYLDHGGTILFDTRDQNYAVQGNVGFGSTRNAESLREMIGALNIPALTQADDEHVLRKSFYLLNDFPGRYTNGPLWVEQQSANGRDGVSSVIIGGNDWAAAWGAEQSGGTLRPFLTGGPRQQEMSLRFGVNMMMYALTGNYKADQVHIPFILERLGQ
ncbi:MAG: DUF4159 domain-containing protein [Pseudomonadota bacterium]